MSRDAALKKRYLIIVKLFQRTPTQTAARGADRFGPQLPTAPCR